MIIICGATHLPTKLSLVPGRLHSESTAGLTFTFRMMASPPLTLSPIRNLPSSFTLSPSMPCAPLCAGLINHIFSGPTVTTFACSSASRIWRTDSAISDVETEPKIGLPFDSAEEGVALVDVVSELAGSSLGVFSVEEGEEGVEGAGGASEGPKGRR